MCIAAIAILQSLHFPLIIVHNRDEFIERKFTPLSKIANHSGIVTYGGIDLKSNGMWFGISETGKIGFITSYRDRSRWNPTAPSRGFLIRDYLSQNDSALDYLQNLPQKIESLNPFNLILGDIQNLYYWNSDKKERQHLSEGLYSISNAFLDTQWPKVRNLKARLSEILKTTDSDDIDSLEQKLHQILLDKTPAPQSELPQTGLPLDQEYALSSIFVDTPKYRTVTSSILILNAKQKLRLTEFQYFEDQNFERRSYEILF